MYSEQGNINEKKSIEGSNGGKDTGINEDLEEINIGKNNNDNNCVKEDNINENNEVRENANVYDIDDINKIVDESDTNDISGKFKDIFIDILIEGMADEIIDIEYKQLVYEEIDITIKELCNNIKYKTIIEASYNNYIEKEKTINNVSVENNSPNSNANDTRYISDEEGNIIEDIDVKENGLEDLVTTATLALIFSKLDQKYGSLIDGVTSIS